MGKTASGSRKAVVLPFWSSAGIPTTTVIHAGTKLSKLEKAYNDLKKNKNKDRPKHRMMRRFSKETSKKSSTSHTLLSPTGRHEGRGQGVPTESERRPGNHPWLELTLVTAKKVEKHFERGTLLKQLRERETATFARLTERAKSQAKAVAAAQSCVERHHPRARGSRSQRKKLKLSPSISVKGFNLISTWDRKNCGCGKQRKRSQLPLKFLEWTLGVWRSRRARSIEHELRGESSRRKRSWNCGTRRYLRGLPFHWDGKLLPSPLWRYGGPRIAVLLTGEDDAEFLLGLPASSDSTGRNVAAWS
ncbi:hypothetical protein GWK47_027600 [Chionoecetes opilio]|uniref:Uncharacterized protein n=1 Tax=Chionoecetes opilio TaxID=41210 RepID=A0A8J8WDZ4_CHIOP|nr:hypothetical protein GWK47_027600 [Chionoecetes opilio]